MIIQCYFAHELLPARISHQLLINLSRCLKKQGEIKRKELM